MRIVIDMQGAQTNFSAHRGVGRYTIGLVKAILKEGSGKYEFILLLNGFYKDSIESIRQEFVELIDKKNIVVWHHDFWFCGADKSTHLNMRVAEILRELAILSCKPNFVFSTNLQEGFFEPAVTAVNLFKKQYQSITTLHDVIPLMNRDQYLSDPIVAEWYSEKIQLVKQSEIVLTVSNSSRNEIIKYTDIDPKKIFVVGNAVDHTKFKKIELTNLEVENFKIKFKLPKKFILYAGGNDKHKDLLTLYKAYARLPVELRQQTALMLVGKELKNDEESIRYLLRKYSVTENIIIAGRLSDQDLITAYNLASVFVFPSKYEGFGLPPLEAMTCGIPVLVSSAPSLVEIVNSDDAIFKISDEVQLAAKIERVLVDKDFSKKLADMGYQRAYEYTWDNSASKFLKLVDHSSSDCLLVEDASYLNEALMNIGELVRGVDNLDQRWLRNVAALLDVNYPQNDRKPILYLDVSAIIINGDHTGIQRVVRAIASELLSKDIFLGDVVLVYTTPEDSSFYFASDLENKWLGKRVKSLNGIERVTFYRGDILLYLDLHPMVTIKHIDNNKHLKNIGVSVYHLVYDLLPIQFKEFFWPELSAEFEQWLNSIFNSTGAICISKAVADNLREWSKQNNKDKLFEIKWFHLGADLEASIPTMGLPIDHIKVINKLSSKLTFLMVGTIEPRKGHEQIYYAFEKLWRKGLDINLIFVGKNGWGMEKFGNKLKNCPEYNNRFHWLEGITDEYLKKIYAASNCLIAASYGEGFGLPLIEAAKFDIPIMCRDIPVFREVAGDNAFYFEASHSDQVEMAIIHWIELYNQGNYPRSRNMKVLTWEDSAKQLINVIQ